MEHSIQLFKNKENCCGCGSCANACPRNAIRMKEDECGFLYPVIQPELCVACGLCRRVCAFQNETVFNSVTAVYAAADTDEKRLCAAASGGVFSSVATQVLKENGVVFGSTWQKTGNALKAVHICASDEASLRRIAGSKYVQSDTSEIFSQVKDVLKTGRTVLFSGTPCQVDALYAYLRKKEYENLVTIDLICHGVPNGRMFNDYLSVIENHPVDNYIFRDKKHGWGLQYAYQYAYHGKTITKRYPSDISSYYHHFLLGDTYRENCYHCKYACEKRCADITIGDYWGIEKEHPEFAGKNGKLDVQKGVSCILVNSEKGRMFLDKYGKELTIFPSELSRVLKWNHQLNTPSKPGRQRDAVLQLYRENGWKGVEAHFIKQRGLKYKIKKLLYSIQNRISEK